MRTFANMAEILEPGSVGAAKLDHYEISKLDAMRSSMSRSAVRMDAIPGETVARLYVEGDGLVMSDSPMERRTNFDIARQARGRVLIAGLGLGMILVPILAKAEVEYVAVVEKSRDVIDLVVPQLQAKVPGAEKLEVICADIFSWRPPKGTKFDVLYFDIWADLCTDNLAEMSRLHQAFKSYKATGGWMDSWAREELKYQKRRESARWGW